MDFCMLSIIVYLTMISYWQIGYWKNQNILFSRVLDVVGPSYPAHIHLAGYYTRHGMLKEAREHSFKAIDRNRLGDQKGLTRVTRLKAIRIR